MLLTHKESSTETSSAPALKLKSLWMPQRVVFTSEAIEEPFGKTIFERVHSLGLPIDIMKNNRITGLRGNTDKETYKIAKNTLAIVMAPPSAFNLRPIPPSADYQFHLAEGCPAYCQYCYLAGSLQGPPAIRVFANLPAILQHTTNYLSTDKITSFEASCYTDPLGIEHLTGGLAETITFFGKQPGSHLRFVTKFDTVDTLLNLEHHGHTRIRVSLNSKKVSKLEGGTAALENRLAALRKLALPKERGGGNYPIGIVLAPIMPLENWKEDYNNLFDLIQQQLDFPTDLTFELITHRFTPGSKQVLSNWYPNTSLEMEEDKRAVKTNKYGGIKYVYPAPVMKELKDFFSRQIKDRFPQSTILYWT